MANRPRLIGLITLLTTIVLTWIQPAEAALPPGNAIKDPYAILRNALPIEQKELRELQHKLEDTGTSVRQSRWPTVNKEASSAQFIVTNRKNQILKSIPENRKNEAELILASLRKNTERLSELSSEKNKTDFIKERQKALKEVGDLEALLLKKEFPYNIPEEFNALPRLLGRANVSIKTTKGEMTAIIDGYNAPLTAGAFIDLALKGFYDGLPFARAEDFYVLQTGDPEGDAIGYREPNTSEDRHVPLEILIPGEKEITYNQTFEDLGLYTQTPVLPFATLGTLGWAHSGQALDDGSSQFFFFLYEAELNPAGRNLIDGRNAAFGYVVEGSEILNSLGVEDKIVSIKVVDGADRLQEHA